MATHHQAYPAVFWQKQEVLGQLQRKSWVQRLDTAIANITAVSLNFWLIKLVKEKSLIFCNSKFSGCVILKNIKYSSTICCDSYCADN